MEINMSLIKQIEGLNSKLENSSSKVSSNDILFQSAQDGKCKLREDYYSGANKKSNLTIQEMNRQKERLKMLYKKRKLDPYLPNTSTDSTFLRVPDQCPDSTIYNQMNSTKSLENINPQCCGYTRPRYTCSSVSPTRAKRHRQ